MAEKTNVPVKPNGQTMRRWDPFEMFEDLQGEMERFWSEWPLTIRPWRLALRRPTATPTTWTPRVDVFEKNGNIVVKAELPGVKPEQVEVTLEEGDMVIRGERKAESEVKEENYYRMERTYGSFYRRMPLPAGIKIEQIKATFADGVLEITIPKPIEEKLKSKKIEIATK